MLPLVTHFFLHLRGEECSLKEEKEEEEEEDVHIKSEISPLSNDPIVLSNILNAPLPVNSIQLNSIMPPPLDPVNATPLESELPNPLD